MGFFDKLFGGGGGDDGSDEIRRQEEERQRKIREGSNRVNNIFGGPIVNEGVRKVPFQQTLPGGFDGDSRSGSTRQLPDRTVTSCRDEPFSNTTQAPGQFDDGYYSSIGKAYLDYYMPQVDEQYQEATRALRLGSPSVQSSSFGRRSGMLARDYERSKADVADRSLTVEGEARTNTENSRNQILSAVRAGSGAEEAANSATQAVRSLKAPPAYSPLGDLFSRYLNTTANATLADNAGFQQTPLSLNTLFRRGGKGALTTQN